MNKLGIKKDIPDFSNTKNREIQLHTSENRRNYLGIVKPS